MRSQLIIPHVFIFCYSISPSIKSISHFVWKCDGRTKFSIFNFFEKNCFHSFYPNEADKRNSLFSLLFPDVWEWYFNYKKSARFAGTFSLRALRAARFARKFERAWGARFDRRASRSVLCSSHTFKFISYNLILKLKPI